jgi:hypothetical protein
VDQIDEDGVNGADRERWVKVQNVKGNLAVVGKSFVVLLGGVMLAHRCAHAQEPGDSGTTAASGDSMVARPSPPQRRAYYLYPVPTSEKLTGFKLTLVAAYLWRTALDGTTRPSAVFHHSAYTANHQLLIGFGGDWWAPQNTRHLNFGVEYTKFPGPFFGIGSRTPKSAQELFTPHTFAIGATAQREIRPHTFAQVGLHISHTSIVETVPGGLLSADTTPWKHRLYRGRSGDRSGLRQPGPAVRSPGWRLHPGYRAHQPAAARHQLGEQLAREEADRALAGLERLSDVERQVVRDLAARLVRRVLYPMSRRLRAGLSGQLDGQDGQADRVEADMMSPSPVETFSALIRSGRERVSDALYIFAVSPSCLPRG